MNQAVAVYRSSLVDPFLNLAIEDYLLRNRPLSERALLLYVNDPAVVIGRHQNPWIECNPELMAQEGVVLARRQSGGGTVYHDRGNLNFTLFSRREDYDQDANFDLVVEALRTLGVAAERSGRNDLVCGGYKISGSAFKHLRERSFHHGTVLVAADLARLSAVLKPAPAEIRSRGIASVRSTVANLIDLVPGGAGSPDAPAELMGRVADALIGAFLDRWGGAVGASVAGSRAAVHELDAAFVAAREQILARADEYRSWDWVYGKTPRFEETVRLGGGVARVYVENGCISGIELNGAREDRASAVWRERLLGAEYRPSLRTQRM